MRVGGYCLLFCFALGPTPNTVSDFWQMLWDQKCPVIVMLTKVEEKGKVLQAAHMQTYVQ